MQCVICKGTAFSVRPCDLGKPPAERYSKYGDCCSMSCALRKTTIAFRKNPTDFKGVKLEGCGKTYIVMIPDPDTDLHIYRPEKKANPGSSSAITTVSNTEL